MWNWWFQIKMVLCSTYINLKYVIPVKYLMCSPSLFLLPSLFLFKRENEASMHCRESYQVSELELLHCTRRREMMLWTLWKSCHKPTTFPTLVWSRVRYQYFSLGTLTRTNPEWKEWNSRVELIYWKFKPLKTNIISMRGLSPNVAVIELAWPYN